MLILSKSIRLKARREALSGLEVLEFEKIWLFFERCESKCLGMKKQELTSKLKKSQDLLFDIVQDCGDNILRKKLLKIIDDLEDIEMEELSSLKKTDFE